MSSSDRSLIKYLSICGIIINSYLFTASFFGGTLLSALPVIVVSGVIMFGLGLSLTLDPLIPALSRRFYFTKFWDGKPSWGRPLYLLLLALLLVQFVLIAMHGVPATPFVFDGEPTIGANGEIVRTSSQAQQLFWNHGLLRFLTALEIVNFYQLLMYALFPLRNG